MTAQIDMDEWRRNLPKIIAGQDPLDEVGGMARYLRRIHGVSDRPARECSVEGCSRPFSAKGFCRHHYDKEYQRKLREAKALKL